MPTVLGALGKLSLSVGKNWGAPVPGRGAPVRSGQVLKVQTNPSEGICALQSPMTISLGFTITDLTLFHKCSSTCFKDHFYYFTPSKILCLSGNISGAVVILQLILSALFGGLR